MTRRRTWQAVSAVAKAVAAWVGSATAWLVVAVAIAAWLIVGITWGFSAKWHMWADTVAAFVTLIMVFVIQHTANHETRAMLVKLDELLRAHDGARNDLMGVEQGDPERLERVDREMREHPHSAP